MNRRKHTARVAATPAPRKISAWFLSPQGGLRGLWLLAVSLLGYALTALALRRGLNAAFAALFRAWGITTENAWRAPEWARLVYGWHGSAVTVLVSAAQLGFTWALRRLWRLGSGATRPDGRAFLRAALAGFASMLCIAALCLVPDSMRLEWPLSAPRLSWGAAVLCAVSLLAALSEEAFLKCAVYDALKRDWGRFRAALAVCAVFFFSYGGYSGNVVSAVNVLLLGGLCLAVYEKGGLWPAVGFRWALSAAMMFALGFGGGDAAIYRMYGVSERLLTGGDAGPVYGLWMTMLLASLLLFLERDAVAPILAKFKRKPRRDQ